MRIFILFAILFNLVGCQVVPNVMPQPEPWGSPDDIVHAYDHKYTPPNEQ